MDARQNILIVDDDRGFRKTLSDILEAKGYATVSTATGRTALAKAKKEKPAVALIDLKLEDISGLEVMEEIKKHCLATECILLTGYASQASAIEAINLGAYSYVQKPYDVEQLLVTIRRAIEKQRAEEALRESEERYRSLFEDIPIGLYQTAPGGQFLAANLALAKMMGYPDRESLLAINATDLYVGSQERAQWLALTEREGGSHACETRLRRRDGTIIWVWETVQAVQDADGQVLHYEGSLEDVTERVRSEEKRARAEEALRQYAERLRALHAIDGAILAAWSAEEIAQAALRHMRQLVNCMGAVVVTFDFETQEMILFALDVNGRLGLDAGTRFPLEETVEIKALWQGQVLVKEDILTLPQPPPTIQALQAAGVCSYIAAPLIAHGKLIGSLILGAESPGAFAPKDMDITREVADQIAVGLHQARLRTALEAERKRLEALVKHLPEGVLLLNGERRILLCNPAAENYLPALTGAGEPPVGHVGDVLTHLAGWPVKELAQSPEGLWREIEVAGPPRRIFGVAAQPVKAEPQPEGWVLLIWDMTQERETEQRTRQQEQLAAIGQLAGGIAHDFNNLLTTIMLYAQMPLGKRDLPPDLTRSFEIILNESRQAAKLVQQILDFSRRSPIETHPVDLKFFVEEAVRILERTIPESISLLLETELEEYVVNADPTRIQQVLMNLVVNARDAMPEGGALRIGLSRIEMSPGESLPWPEMPPLSSPPLAGGTEGGEWVCLAVSDTGTGISPEALPHIFEPFFTTKPRGEGTGLGLAQVYGIVKQHEGHIGVETKVGQGTTFRVYLPAYEVGEDGAPQERAVPAAPKGKGETILLVEDSEGIREAGQRILESLGYRVLTAANGREALEIYRSAEKASLEPHPELVKGQGRRIDLVLTDVVMPEMGGKELIQELRKMDPGLKVLGITGYALAKDLRELKKSGILDVVNKPLDVNVLARTIRRALDTK